ncbi:MAG: hypothetical protein JSR36_05930 [Proteobacteria bacterium]|nr:hypothetical protein [Pseudomonadota bacterium]
MSGDLRGWRIALAAGGLVNPGAQAPDHARGAMGVIEECGYGVLQLPPPGPHALLLAVLCDQVAEYAHHGYAVVALGLQGETGQGLHWRRLASLLRARNVSLPPRHVVRLDVTPAVSKQRLAQFLSSFDLPVAEQQRWRV